MEKKIAFSVDNDVYNKFIIALQLTGDDENEVFDSCIKAYIAKTFGAISHEYSNANSTKQSADNRDYYGKALQRIPAWSLKPNQYNHKIIKAFLEIEKVTGTVSLDAMEKLCSNKVQSELYVPTIKNNYAQMKIDGPKSHGKVFEDDGDHVWIWNEVEPVLRQYQGAFLA